MHLFNRVRLFTRSRFFLLYSIALVFSVGVKTYSAQASVFPDLIEEPQRIANHPVSQGPFSSRKYMIEDVQEPDFIATIENLSADVSGMLFPEGTWLGMDKKFLTAAFHALPETHGTVSNSGEYDLLLAILKTGINSRLMPEIWISPRGTDLLTVRMEKLNSLGAFDEAAALYRQIPGKPYHVRQVTSGIISLLGSGRIEEACIDIFSFSRYFDDADLQTKMKQACEHRFSGAHKTGDGNGDGDRNQNFFKIDMDTLKTMSLLELSLLVNKGKTNTINYTLSEDYADYSQISLGKTALLLTHDGLPENIRLKLALLSYKSGFFKLENLENTYKTVSANGLNGEWANIISTFKALNKDKGPALYEISDAVIELFKKRFSGTDKAVSSMAYHPFARYIQPFTFEQLDSEQKNFTLYILAGAMTNGAFGKEIILRHLKTDTLSLDRKESFYLLTSFLIQPQDQDKDSTKSHSVLHEFLKQEKSPAGRKDLSDTSSSEAPALFYTDPVNDILEELTYEKRNHLTLPQDYVMHLYGINNFIDFAIKTNNVGQQALLLILDMKYRNFSDDKFFRIDALSDLINYTFDNQVRILINSGLLNKVK